MYNDLLQLKLNQVWEDELIAKELMETHNTINQLNSSDKFYLDRNEALAVNKWVKSYCHNLLNKQLNYENVEPAYLQEQVAQVICHNSQILVNEFRNLQLLQNLEFGANVNSKTTNPYRKINGTQRPVLNEQVFNQNYFDVMAKQGMQMKQAHAILSQIYSELKLMTIQYF